MSLTHSCIVLGCMLVDFGELTQSWRVSPSKWINPLTDSCYVALLKRVEKEWLVLRRRKWLLEAYPGTLSPPVLYSVSITVFWFFTTLSTSWWTWHLETMTKTITLLKLSCQIWWSLLWEGWLTCQGDAHPPWQNSARAKRTAWETESYCLTNILPKCTQGRVLCLLYKCSFRVCQLLPLCSTYHSASCAQKCSVPESLDQLFPTTLMGVFTFWL